MISGVQEAYFELYNKDLRGLAEHFSVNPSSCENSEFYRQYLLFDALADQISGKSTTHVFIDDTEKRIMGFLSLRASSLISKDDKDILRGKPAIEISVLAVDERYEGRCVGKTLVALALSEAATLHEKHIGVTHIVLSADTKAVGFYEKMGFKQLRDHWDQIPSESFSSSCVPMFRDLQFELQSLQSFIDESDDEDD